MHVIWKSKELAVNWGQNDRYDLKQATNMGKAAAIPKQMTTWESICKDPNAFQIYVIE